MGLDAMLAVGGDICCIPARSRARYRGGRRFPFLCACLFPFIHMATDAHARIVVGVSQFRMLELSSTPYSIRLCACRSSVFGLWLVAACRRVRSCGQDRADAVHANQAQAFASSTDAVRPGAGPFAATHLRRVLHRRLVHALPRTSASASLFQATCVVPPSFAHSLAVREHVTALTSALLSTGPSRAPPAA